MAEPAQNEKNIPSDGKEGEEEYSEEAEDLEKEEKDTELTEEEEEGEVKEEENVMTTKKRKCQRRKKIRQICFDDEDEDEDIEGERALDVAEEEEVEEEDEEEEEEEECDIISTGTSVYSAISFVWENEVYEFEELCDTGNIDGIRPKIFQEAPSLDEYGIKRYLEVCTAMKIAPMISLLRFLKTKEIDLSYRNIDSCNIKAMCAALELNRTVERLIFKYNKLTVEDCLYIGLILHYNRKISSLDFTGCRVGAQGLELLISYLLQNETVVDLNFSKCDIQDEGVKLLSYVFMNSNTIKKVDLSYNKLGEESAGALAWAFKTNNTITYLNLRYNNLFEPASMRGLLRYLSTSFAITHLDLSWNGLSGEEMGIYISNFLKRSKTIVYLDLSDNRLQGLAVMEIKSGLPRAITLETLKMGKNPMSPEDLESLLSSARWCPKLKVLDFEDLWVNTSFVKTLKKMQEERDIEVIFEGIYGNYEVKGPDYSKLILQRAQFEAQKPKSKKKKRDFGHLMWTLGEEPLSKDEFELRVKKFKAKINKELFPELIKQFLVPKAQLIDVVAMREKYLSIFPDSTPPPPPKPKGKGKGQNLKGDQVKETKEELPIRVEESKGGEKDELILVGSEEFEENLEDFESSLEEYNENEEAENEEANNTENT